MDSIAIDDSGYPLVVVTFEGTVDDATFDGYLKRMDDYVARRQRNAFVFDASGAGRTPAPQRRKQAEWMKINEATLRAFSAGCAFVITSPLVRGALTAILWLQNIPSPYTVVGTRSEAERWARAQLQAPAPKAA
jgi:hypothetical protein